jgi:hypothetical protein
MELLYIILSPDMSLKQIYGIAFYLFLIELQKPHFLIITLPYLKQSTTLTFNPTDWNAPNLLAPIGQICPKVYEYSLRDWPWSPCTHTSTFMFLTAVHRPLPVYFLQYHRFLLIHHPVIIGNQLMYDMIYLQQMSRWAVLHADCYIPNSTDFIHHF